jgi:AraC family transcriptional regulator
MPGTVSDELTVKTLLSTPIVSVRDVCCQGTCRHKSPEEFAGATHLVFPYRGAYVRHLGQDEAVAEANQVLFFNQNDGYRVSHPINGGDSCLTLQVDEELLRELAPKELLRDGPTVAFRQQRMPIDPRAQALVALLRHSLDRGIAEPLEAESLALTLVRRTLRPEAVRAPVNSPARQKLVDRAKLLLTSDLSRRWTLAEIAAEVGGSAVYLTQVFQQVEGMPLYRYQLNLRLARALDLMAEYDDLTALGLELGFSSHSHFTSAFQRTYGRSPSEFRRFAFNR